MQYAHIKEPLINWSSLHNTSPQLTSPSPLGCVLYSSIYYVPPIFSVKQSRHFSLCCVITPEYMIDSFLGFEFKLVSMMLGHYSLHSLPHHQKPLPDALPKVSIYTRRQVLHIDIASCFITARLLHSIFPTQEIGMHREDMDDTDMR